MTHERGTTASKVPRWRPMPSMVSVEMPSGEDARQRIRSFVRRTMLAWDVDPSSASAVLDVTDELLGNALRHGRQPITLTLERSTAVRVLVRDASREMATVLPYRSGVSHHGLGLRLVRQLSDQWGQLSDDNGKVVWAEIGPAVRPRQRRVARAAG
jgi:two-component sensor histidine kinase